ncbi:hypothetical protein P9273_31920 [Mesorhizobium sp. WSM4935]|uniref:hypothetical protein n=1 Tax=Mesorhizobium sp. WSM4935 TaxID=3038547 RepID=UPI000ACE839A|nr:hypothetical protein [Mesorhizobium sp. WSM4935]MDG4879670.1 hypothetical protein [Mesorhizobium sp. WSM4935]
MAARALRGADANIAVKAISDAEESAARELPLRQFGLSVRAAAILVGNMTVP